MTSLLERPAAVEHKDGRLTSLLVTIAAAVEGARAVGSARTAAERNRATDEFLARIEN